MADPDFFAVVFSHSLLAGTEHSVNPFITIRTIITSYFILKLFQFPKLS